MFPFYEETILVITCQLQDFLETLGRMDNGMLVDREDVGELCKYQRIQVFLKVQVDVLLYNIPKAPYN